MKGWEDTKSGLGMVKMGKNNLKSYCFIKINLNPPSSQTAGITVSVHTPTVTKLKVPWLGSRDEASIKIWMLKKINRRIAYLGQV